jgi:FkbM family methyltransferase
MMSKKITNDDFSNLFKEKTSVFFIQIGANNGVTVDPVNKLIKSNPSWSGILFEPGSQAFQELIKTYEGFDDLVLLNMAVSDIDGITTLYCGETTPHFTLDKMKATHMFNVVPREVEVSVISPKTIMEEFGVSHLDLLQIDTEGRDFTIIKSFIENGLLPDVIRFEYVNLNYENTNGDQVIDFLSGFGYESFYVENEGDIVSILKK